MRRLRSPSFSVSDAGSSLQRSRWRRGSELLQNGGRFL
uniref:Uncharacterized protein n=1 Tax=Anguilla anguilla TaxID=7936 RepID=A0A0E9TTG1_ANGAN